jgi:hypothetical protein
MSLCPSHLTGKYRYHGVMSVLARGTRQLGTVHVSDRTRTSAAGSCTRSPNIQHGVRPRV